MKFYRHPIPLPPQQPPKTIQIEETAQHLKDAREALKRGEDAVNKAQALDAINSAQLFLTLAKARLASADKAPLVVKKDKSGRSTIAYKTVGGLPTRLT